jgi:hypothetical protein
MKTMLILLTLITSVTINNELKRKVNLIKSKTELPFELTKDIRPCRPTIALNSELKDYLSFHAYKDIGGRKKIWDHSDYMTCFVFQRFHINNRNIELLDIHIDLPEFGRDVLITIDVSGQPIDTLEVSFGSSLINGPYIYFKQYKLNENLELYVYQLIPTLEKVIECLPGISHAELQRIDTRYLIDENGKFVKKSETRYNPQTYDINVLSQKEYNIWNGTETPLDTH